MTQPPTPPPKQPHRQPTSSQPQPKPTVSQPTNALNIFKWIKSINLPGSAITEEIIELIDKNEEAITNQIEEFNYKMKALIAPALITPDEQEKAADRDRAKEEKERDDFDAEHNRLLELSGLDRIDPIRVYASLQRKDLTWEEAAVRTRLDRRSRQGCFYCGAAHPAEACNLIPRDFLLNEAANRRCNDCGMRTGPRRREPSNGAMPRSPYHAHHEDRHVNITREASSRGCQGQRLADQLQPTWITKTGKILHKEGLDKLLADDPKELLNLRMDRNMKEPESYKQAPSTIILRAVASPTGELQPIKLSLVRKDGKIFSRAIDEKTDWVADHNQKARHILETGGRLIRDKSEIITVATNFRELWLGPLKVAASAFKTPRRCACHPLLEEDGNQHDNKEVCVLRAVAHLANFEFSRRHRAEIEAEKPE